MNSFFQRLRRAPTERLTRAWAPYTVCSRLSAPVVSFTFDDFPRSALTVGGELLKKYGARGSYFLCGGFAGQRAGETDYFDVEDLSSAVADGHEIGCHTFDHLSLVGSPSQRVRESLARNASFVREHLPEVMMTSFAYPFGRVNPHRKFLVGNQFHVSRGIWPGVNAGEIDYYQLRAVPLEARSHGKVDIAAFLDEAVRRKGWLVFFSHDIADRPSPFGYQPGELERVIDAVVARGIEILPLKAAAARARFG